MHDGRGEHGQENGKIQITAPPPLPLERVPTRWNHLVEKNSLEINGLSMILSQKWFPLLRIML